MAIYYVRLWLSGIKSNKFTYIVAEIVLKCVTVCNLYHVIS